MASIPQGDVFGFATAPEMVLDGVHRLPPTGVSVLIVGGGIGGIFMALESWRQGHNVRVLERAQSLEAIGDTFGIQPSAFTTLRYYPTLLKAFHAFTHDALLSLYRHGGRKLVDVGEADWNNPGAVHQARDVRVSWILRRYTFLEALVSQAGRLGITIEYGKNVTEYDEDETKGFVRTDDGDVYYGDVVVAADGVGTKSHRHITGIMQKPSSSGYAVYRGMIPIDRLANVSQDTRERIMTGDRPEFRLYLGLDMHANVIITREFVNYLLTHTDTGSADESWRSTVSGADVLKTMEESPGWDPAVKEIFAQTPDNSVIDWKLLWRNPQPQWYSNGGRVVQLGDSAHSFLPTSGNGAAQAMEDGMSLATCLRLGGKGDVANSVKAHSVMRFERVSTLQRFGFATRQILHQMDLDAVEKDPSQMKMRMGRWIWSHDAAGYARENYHKALKSVTEGAIFENTNLPPGHKYDSWTIEDELKREKSGLRTELFDTGDWS